jgi:hypothetical protein
MIAPFKIFTCLLLKHRFEPWCTPTACSAGWRTRAGRRGVHFPLSADLCEYARLCGTSDEPGGEGRASTVSCTPSSNVRSYKTGSKLDT